MDKLINIILPESNNTGVDYLYTTLFVLATIIFIWSFFYIFAYLLKIKLIKWQDDRYKKKFFRSFFSAEQKSIQNSILYIRNIIFLTIILLFLSHILEISAVKLQAVNSSAHNFISELKISSYMHISSVILDKLNLILLNIFLTILIAMWCIKLLNKSVGILLNKFLQHNIKNSRKLAKKKTLNTIIQQFIKIIVGIMVIFLILENLGLNLSALLATAGLASVAIAFGTQNILKDFISGFFILCEDQFAVGDIVELGTMNNVFNGSIEKMSLRITSLRSMEGSLVILQNSDIKTVKNYSHDFAQIEARYSLPLSADLTQAAKIFQQEVDRFYQDFQNEIIAIPEIRLMEKILEFEHRSCSTTFKVFIKVVNFKTKINLEMELNKRLIEKLQTQLLIS